MQLKGCRYYEAWERKCRGPGGGRYLLDQPIWIRGKLCFTWWQALEELDKILGIKWQVQKKKKRVKIEEGER